MLLFRPISTLLFASICAALPSTRSVGHTWPSISVSRTLSIDGQPFYLPTEPVAAVEGSFSTEVLPVTVITSNSSKITVDSIETVISEFKTDDVFSDSFLQGVVIIYSGKGKGTVSLSVTSYLAELGVKTVLFQGISSYSHASGLSTSRISGLDLVPGPYVISKNATGATGVYKPYKLFFDETQSFFKSVHSLKDGSFTVVSANGDTDSSPYVAIPSKIYAKYEDSSKYPLAGVRVTVKDIYFLKGITASCGNRAFYATYGTQNASSTAVARLVELGADIVGTTKTVQFANGDRATADWVDYHAPFSARGDSMMEPSGSSTGAGASTGAHDWLDVGIGSDTGGSVRLPASLNGLFGFRPSVGAIDLTNVMPLSDVLDTGGYMSRDPKLFRAFGKAWYAENPTFKSYPSYPKSLLRSTSFDSVSTAALEVYDTFIGKLQDYLGATVSNFSLSAEWNETGTSDIPINIYFNETYSTLVAYHQWQAVGSKLFADHAAKFGGREPHINPSVLKRWQYGIARGAANYSQEVTNQQTFENWTTSNFIFTDSESCSSAIFLYPINSGSYSSRETYYSGPAAPPTGFSDSRLSVYSRSPEVTVPIGQIPYHSNITGITEYLPVSISLVAHRSCDFMLLDLVGALADDGIIQTVKAGRTAF